MKIKSIENKSIRPIDRLVTFIKYLDISHASFERKVDIANGYILNQSKKGGSIGSIILLKIKTKFTQIDLNWIITGEGEMLKYKIIELEISEVR